MGWIALIVAMMAWMAASSRTRRLEREIDTVRDDHGEKIRELRRRIAELERSSPQVPAAAPSGPAAVAPPPVPVAASIAEDAPMVFTWDNGRLEPNRVQPTATAEPELGGLFSAELLSPSSHVPTHLGGEPRRTTQDWEALIGGNWLNKLGVFVLVVGIALFLGYSFANTGAAGRVAIGLSVGAAMLAGGAWWERRDGFQTFARGLMGGGWAAIYFTTFAMHGVPAAKIVEDPFIATTLLLSVAAGMILHSLRYKSETASGVAYFVAFATLAIADSTPFAVTALLPLAASLLYLAHRFDWRNMALFGAFATYGTCALRPDEGATLAATQAIFLAYWGLYEVFDVVRLRGRSKADGSAEWALLPLNWLACLGMSLAKWNRTDPGHMHILFAGMAVIGAASALVRAWLRPPASYRAPPEEDPMSLDGFIHGGYELPALVATASSTMAILQGLSNAWLAPALLAQAELLFLAGLRFGEPFLRALGGFVFLPALAKITVGDGSLNTPMALTAAAVFYANRVTKAMERSAYGACAAGLVTLVVGVKAPEQWLGAAWLGLAGVLFELGFRLRLREFRYQGYIVAAMGAFTGVAWNVLGSEFGASQWPLAMLTLLTAAGVVRSFTLEAREDWLEGELGVLRDASTAAATGFAMALAWFTLPVVTVALAWTGIALMLFEFGFAFDLRSFRVIGNVAALAGFGRLFFANFTDLGDTARVSHRLLTVVPVVFAHYYVWSRYEKVETSEAGRRIARLYLFTPAILAAVLMRFELGRSLAAVAWGAFAVALFQAGRLLRLRDLRFQGYAMAGIAVWRCWSTNFYIADSLGGLPERILSGAAVVACLFAAQLLAPPDSATRERSVSRWERLDRHARSYFALLGALLLAALLFHQVSGGTLTVAWSAEALLLLGAGFPLRDRLQRWTGLALLLGCVGKLFFWDLRNLETLNRIVSFIALGAILVGVSWLYTRFRDRIQQYL